MQFVESTDFFVRTVMYDFVSNDANNQLKFLLTPMIHIGSKTYYENVLENLKTCDEIFYEGLELLDSKAEFHQKITLRNLNLTFNQYELIAEQLDLVTQSKHFNLRKLNIPLTHVDFNPETGRKAWNRLKFVEQIKLTFVKPIRMFYYHLGISRAFLAKAFMTSNEEAYLAYGPIEDEDSTAENFVMNEREQIIFKKIDERINAESSIDKTIGIVYGAAHMKSIARYLIDQHNYVPRSGKFVRVFNVCY